MPKEDVIKYNTKTPVDLSKDQNSVFCKIIDKIEKSHGVQIPPFVLYVDSESKQTCIYRCPNENSVCVRLNNYLQDIPFQMLYLWNITIKGRELHINEKNIKEIIEFVSDVDEKVFSYFLSEYKFTTEDYKKFLLGMYLSLKTTHPKTYEYWMLTIEKRIKLLKEKFPEEADKEKSENTSPETNNKTKWWHTALLVGIFMGLLSLVAYIIF